MGQFLSCFIYTVGQFIRFLLYTVGQLYGFLINTLGTFNSFLNYKVGQRNGFLKYTMGQFNNFLNYTMCNGGLNYTVGGPVERLIDYTMDFWNFFLKKSLRYVVNKTEKQVNSIIFLESFLKMPFLVLK